DGVPDRGAGEADDGVDAEVRGGAGRVHDLGGGAAADALRFAVAPDPLREDRLVAFVGVVADGLADEVVGDGPHLQVVLGEGLQLARDVVVVGDGLVDLEVVAPAGDLQAVVAPA